MTFPKFTEALSSFQSRLTQQPGASHAQLRELFIDFLRQSLDIETERIDRERGVSLAHWRGSVDAVYQDIVFEFKRDLSREREEGKNELSKYLSALGPQEYFGILTDDRLFEVYHLRDGGLVKTDEVNLFTLSPEAAFAWLDSLFFSARDLPPTPEDVVRRFGPLSTVFLSSTHRLAEMFGQVKAEPEVEVKFKEWDVLLSRVYGSRVGSPELFLRHTYLSLLVKVMAFLALYQRRPGEGELLGLADGEAFRHHRPAIDNLGEKDFFSWVLTPTLEAEIRRLLRGLAQHLSVYAIARISQDLLKELYERLLEREAGHDLGEYYTPDWLAEFVLRQAGFGRETSLLDPACGSGTFLFTALRLWRELGLLGGELVREAQQKIVGIDVHPLAVTIAKANYVLALAPAMEGYGGRVSLPIYMANSLERPQRDLQGEHLNIPAEGGTFRIPLETVKKAEELDEVVEEMGRYAEEKAEPERVKEGFRSYLERRGLGPWAPSWMANLDLMRKLVAQKRDTIWAFILKNSYRPLFLSITKFDIVAGNPPWLSYRYIRDTEYQKEVKSLAFSYELLERREVKLFTQMDTSTVFFGHCLRRYLADGGKIAFVLPLSVITGAKQHQGFQKTYFSQVSLIAHLEGVSPLFNVSACVIVAGTIPSPQPIPLLRLKGELPTRNLHYAQAQSYLSIESESFQPLAYPKQKSYYYDKFKQGATIVPRTFYFVIPTAAEASAAPSLMTDPEILAGAKSPWRLSHQGEVEAEFLYGTLLSKHLLPFGCLKLSPVVLPLYEGHLLKREAALARGHRHLAAWLGWAEAEWQKAKKTNFDLYQRLDYRRTLTDQRPGGYKVLYNTSGTNLAACVIDAGKGFPSQGLALHGFVADSKTYWYSIDDPIEAHYLCALLNSEAINLAIKPYQPRGQWGERDIHRRPLEVVPITLISLQSRLHLRLAELSQVCHQKVAQAVPRLEGKSIGRLRGEVRGLLAEEIEEIDRLTRRLFPSLS